MNEMIIILKEAMLGIKNILPYAVIAVYPSIVLSRSIMKKVYQELQLHQDQVKNKPN